PWKFINVGIHIHAQSCKWWTDTKCYVQPIFVSGISIFCEGITIHSLERSADVSLNERNIHARIHTYQHPIQNCVVKVSICCYFTEEMQIAMGVAIVNAHVTPTFSSYGEQIIWITSPSNWQ